MNANHNIYIYIYIYIYITFLLHFLLFLKLIDLRIMTDAFFPKLSKQKVFEVDVSRTNQNA